MSWLTKNCFKWKKYNFQSILLQGCAINERHSHTWHLWRKDIKFPWTKPNPRPQKLLDKVISALNSQFPQTPVVQATALAAFNNWPNKGEDSLAGYYLLLLVTLVLVFWSCLNPILFLSSKIFVSFRFILDFIN